jgi:TP901 family phage tail tape measure protein
VIILASVGAVTVELNLDASKLTSGLKSAISQLDAFGKKAEGVEKKLSGLSGGSALSKIGGSIGSLGTAALVTGAAAATAAVGGLALGAEHAITTFRDFEKVVTNTASVTGLTGEAFAKAKENISAVSQELGSKTFFSSKEAADALYILASAGVDVATMTTSQLKPALDLAAGTQTDLTQTMDTLIAVAGQFGISFEDNARISDLFAKSIAGSQATMDKLAYSFNYVGPVARTAGMSVEGTTAALSALYDSGLKGQQAGTGLRGVLASLVNPSKNATAALAGMGITADQVNPATQGLANVMQLLHDKGVDATQLFQLFGRTAAPAAGILINNVEALKKYNEEFANVSGSAGTMAAQQMDTLAGSIELLKGDFENLFINVGRELTPMVRQVLGGLKDLMPGIESFAVGAAQSFATFVGGLGSSVDSVLTIGSTISDVFLNIFKSLSGSDLGSGLADMINGVMLRIAGIIVEAAPLIQSAIIGIIKFIQDVFSGLGPTVDNLKSIAMDIVSVIVALFSGISGATGGNAAAGVAGTINSITGILASFSSTIASKLIEIAPTIQRIFLTIVGAFLTFVANFDSIKTQVEAKVAAIGMVFGQLAQKLAPSFTAIKAAFDAGMGALMSSTGGGEGIWATLKETWDNLPKILMEVVTKLQPVWDLLNAAFTFASGVFQGFIANIGPTWDNIKSIFENGLKLLSEVGGDIGKALAGMFSSMGEGDGGKGLGKSIAETINAISGAVADLMKWLADNPKIVEFGIALAGIAVAGAGLVIAFAGVLTALAPFIEVIATIIAVVAEFGISWTAIGTIVGIIVSTIFPGLAAAIGVVIGFITPLAGAIIPALGVAFSVLSTAIGIVVYTVIPILLEMLALILTPVGLVIAGIALLAVAWSRNWFDIQGKTQAAVDFISEQWEALKAAVAEIGPAFSEAAVTLSGIWDGIKTSIKTKLDEIIADVTKWVSDQATKLSEFITNLTTFNSTASTTWATIKAAVLAILSQIIADIVKWVTDHVAKLNEFIANLRTFNSTASSTWAAIKAAVLAILNQIIADIVKWVADHVAKLAEFIAKLGTFKTTVTTTWTTIKTSVLAVLNQIIADIVKWVADHVAKLAEFISRLLAFKTTATNTWEGIKTAIKAKLDQIYADIKELPNKIRELASAFAAAGKAILDSLGNAIESGLASAKKKAEAGLSKIKKLLPNSPAKEGPFKQLPYWGDVIPGPIEDGIRQAEKLVFPLTSVLARLKSPIGDMTSADSPVKPMAALLNSIGKIEDVKTKLDKLNTVGFDDFNSSLQTTIDKMLQVVDASDNMVQSMKSNSGFSVSGMLPSNAERLLDSTQIKSSQTNIKIGTQNNYQNGSSARSLRNSLASN